MGDRDAVRIVLSTVAEVVGELTGDTMHRQSDAIDLIERLLPDARLSRAISCLPGAIRRAGEKS
ncbi:MAG: hypothetical protein IPM79_33360 [Polyangiaceae bacterium]|nr:hypothetical protein [Polyangiaceae bacterium]